MYELLNTAANHGNEILLKYYRTQSLDIANKTDHQNIVTRADKESQKAIQEVILNLMQKKGQTDIGFIGEEDLYTTGRHMFVIDPLDGTSNFASGIDYFCIPIAYFRDGELIAGIVSRPTMHDLYYAEKGKGAFIIRRGNKIPLTVTEGNLKNKVLSIYPEDIALLSEVRRSRVEKMFPLFRSVRSLGAAALDIVGVAENIYGASLLTESPRIWDIAAAKIILEEAGGKMYTWQGNNLEIDITDKNRKYDPISCHPAQKQEIFSYILD